MSIHNVKVPDKSLSSISHDLKKIHIHFSIGIFVVYGIPLFVSLSL